MIHKSKAILSITTFILLCYSYISTTQAEQYPYGAPPGYGSGYGGYPAPPPGPWDSGRGSSFNTPSWGSNRGGPSFSGPWDSGRGGHSMPWDSGRGGHSMPWDSGRGGWMDRDRFVDRFGDSWDDMINAPSDMGEMPGGWSAPSVGMPNPADVGDQFGTAAEDLPDQMRNVYDENRQYNSRYNRYDRYDRYDRY